LFLINALVVIKAANSRLVGNSDVTAQEAAWTINFEPVLLKLALMVRRPRAPRATGPERVWAGISLRLVR